MENLQIEGSVTIPIKTYHNFQQLQKDYDDLITNLESDSYLVLRKRVIDKFIKFIHVRNKDVAITDLQKALDNTNKSYLELQTKYDELEYKVTKFNIESTYILNNELNLELNILRVKYNQLLNNKYIKFIIKHCKHLNYQLNK